MTRADKSTLYFANIKYKDRNWFGEREIRWLNLHARLKPGKTVAEAQAELAKLQNQLRAAEGPGPNTFISVAPAFSAGKTKSFWITMATALGRARLGDRCTIGGGRGPLARDPSVVDRKLSAGVRRRRGRHAARAVECRASLPLGVCPIRRKRFCQNRAQPFARLARVGLRDVFIVAQRRRIRPGSRFTRHTPGPGCGYQCRSCGGRRTHCPFPAAQWVGRRAGRALFRPVDSRRAAAARPGEGARLRPRL